MSDDDGPEENEEERVDPMVRGGVQNEEGFMLLCFKVGTEEEAKDREGELLGEVILLLCRPVEQ